MRGLNVVCRFDVEVRDKSLPTVAVDAGLQYCLQEQLNVIMAIGDFDSLNKELLDAYRGERQVMPAEKAVSDLELAFEFLKNYQESIYVYGALNRRMDHSLVNLKLCYYSDLAIRLIDDYNLIYKLGPGTHKIATNEYKYYSFLSFCDCNISLRGFKYPLENYLLNVADNLTLSNELSDDVGEMTIDKSILVFCTKDS